ncbi:exosome complex component CSL4 isoform 1-T1 [Podargus strigoides]
MASPARYCVPGERLCSAEEATAGSGTYTRHGFIFSSLAGCLEKRSEDGGLPVVSVVRDIESQLLPDVGAVVTCKVCSINSRFAKVHILYVGSTPLKSTFRGTIRREDIRATEKDKVSEALPVTLLPQPPPLLSAGGGALVLLLRSTLACCGVLPALSCADLAGGRAVQLPAEHSRERAGGGGGTQRGRGTDGAYQLVRDAVPTDTHQGLP